MSNESHYEFPIGHKIRLPGHFNEPVILEAVRQIVGGFELQVRLSDGSLEETILSSEEAETITAQAQKTPQVAELADPEDIRLLIESARIRLAYAHDRQFAVSMSGIRTLPHQIEAVYLKMLPQPRLRFLLADDPGAGKTIMAGLLFKEMKLREAVEKILILCPAPLTIQWQDELLRWFGEPFEIIFSARDQQQLVNPWQKSNQVIASIDYAKQEGVRERVWQQHWDLIIIDEAHKCSAYTKRYAGRADEVEKTRRYQLAERLSYHTDHLLLLTATPHHGDDDRFGHFIRLIDPDIFPEPHKVGSNAQEIRKDVLRLGPDCPWSLRRLKEDLKDLKGRRLFPDRHAQTVTFRLNGEEYDLYKAVTAYINEFLAQATGKKKQSVALARQRAENNLADLERIKKERLAGLQLLTIARHGPVRHIASALVFPSLEAEEPQLIALAKEIDPETARKIELAAEEIVIRFETSEGRECQKVGHLKIGFDIRSLTPPESQTGYRDPVTGVRRIEVKGRKKGQPIRLTTNEWFKATPLGDSYWLYVVWDPLENPDAEPLCIQNPAHKLDHVKREVAETRFFEIPAVAINKDYLKEE